MEKLKELLKKNEVKIGSFPSAINEAQALCSDIENILTNAVTLSDDTKEMSIVNKALAAAQALNKILDQI
jgi:hypothetical protein